MISYIVLALRILPSTAYVYYVRCADCKSFPQRCGPVLKQRRIHQLFPVVQHDGVLTRRKDSLVASLDNLSLVRCKGVREGFAVQAVRLQRIAQISGVVDGVVQPLTSICSSIFVISNRKFESERASHAYDMSLDAQRLQPKSHSHACCPTRWSAIEKASRTI